VGWRSSSRLALEAAVWDLDFLFPEEPLLDNEPPDFFFLVCSLDEEGVPGLEVLGVDEAVRVAVFRKNNWSKIDGCWDLLEPFPDIVDELNFNATGGKKFWWRKYRVRETVTDRDSTMKVMDWITDGISPINGNENGNENGNQRTLNNRKKNDPSIKYGCRFSSFLHPDEMNEVKSRDVPLALLDESSGGRTQEKEDVESQGSGSWKGRSMIQESFADSKMSRSQISMVLDDKSKFYVRLVQYVNILVASLFIVYFFCIHRLNVAFEYGQMSFVLSLLISLDSQTFIKQRLWLVYGVAIGVLWSYISILDAELAFPVENMILTIVAEFFFLGGMIYSVIVINRISPSEEFKLVEIDILLYLIALNAICFFSSNNSFNNNLHMILDIRMMVVLYNGFYQLKNKMNLLKLKSFLLLIGLIIFAFIIYTRITQVTDLLFSIIYVFVGWILFYEAWSAKLRYQIEELIPL
jgi:hypothetical protein